MSRILDKAPAALHGVFGGMNAAMQPWAPGDCMNNAMKHSIVVVDPSAGHGPRLGARMPIILTSRADKMMTRLENAGKAVAQ